MPTSLYIPESFMCMLSSLNICVNMLCDIHCQGTWFGPGVFHINKNIYMLLITTHYTIVCCNVGLFIALT